MKHAAGCTDDDIHSGESAGRLSVLRANRSAYI
jgi:hypothetical protein